MRTLAVTLALAAVVPPAVASTPAPGSHASRKGCKFQHPSADSYLATTRLLKHERPVGQATKARVQKWATCLATRRKAHAVHVHVRGIWAWRHSYAHRWPIIFNRLPSWEQSWAWSTGACESGNNPATNTGNGYLGAFQFLLSTWSAAGGTSSPHLHSWHYQAVIAVGWMHRAGAGQWPVCGR